MVYLDKGWNFVAPAKVVVKKTRIIVASPTSGKSYLEDHLRAYGLSVVDTDLLIKVFAPKWFKGKLWRNATPQQRDELDGMIGALVGQLMVQSKDSLVISNLWGPEFRKAVSPDYSGMLPLRVIRTSGPEIHAVSVARGGDPIPAALASKWGKGGRLSTPDSFNNGIDLTAFYAACIWQRALDLLEHGEADRILSEVPMRWRSLASRCIQAAKDPDWRMDSLNSDFLFKVSQHEEGLSARWLFVDKELSPEATAPRLRWLTGKEVEDVVLRGFATLMDAISFEPDYLTRQLGSLGIGNPSFLETVRLLDEKYGTP